MRKANSLALSSTLCGGKVSDPQMHGKTVFVHNYNKYGRSELKQEVVNILNNEQHRKVTTTLQFVFVFSSKNL